MVMERERPTSRSENIDKHQAIVVPFRPNRQRSGIPKRWPHDHWPHDDGFRTTEGQAAATSLRTPRTAGSSPGSGAFASIPPPRDLPDGVIDGSNGPLWITKRPRRILLATDLSFRCERALERAAALSAYWQAALVVLHVLDVSGSNLLETDHRPSWRPSDPLARARKNLLAAVGAVSKTAKLLIREGDPIEEIARTATAEQCDVIVLGIAQDRLFGRLFLTGSMDRLLRRTRVPLLVVKNPARGPYRRVAVPTDFSEISRCAVETAARFFPERPLTIFHAYEAPFSRLMDNSEAYPRALRTIAAQECDAFLKTVDREVLWQRPHVMIERGVPHCLLRDYVHDTDVDVVVLGARRRNAILEMFVGSVSKAIMDEVSCDVLVVPKPRAVDAV